MEMSVVRTLIIAGFVALSANAAFAANDGTVNERIRNQGLPGHSQAGQMQQRSPVLREGRSSADTPAPVYRRHNQKSRSVRQ
jgi:hypothetical protein